MTESPIGRLERADLRDAWTSESSGFTPWLADPDNLKILGDTIGLDLEVEAQEKNVGPFRADILCKDLRTGDWVLIENQLERTDHIHLGQLLVYSSGLKAVTIVWVARQFTEEHRAALDWLNAITGEEFRFFGLEIELWRIGSSAAAPKFNIVSKPNDWSRQVTQAAQRMEASELSDIRKTQLEFWTGFMEYLATRGSKIRTSVPQPQHWATFAIGRSGFRIEAYAGVRDGYIGVNLILNDQNAKQYFRMLFNHREIMEKEMGIALNWDELPQYKMSQVYTGKQPADFAQRGQWPEFYKWLAEKIEAYTRVFGPRIRNLRLDPATGISNGGTHFETVSGSEGVIPPLGQP